MLRRPHPDRILLIRSAPITLEAGSVGAWDLTTNRIHIEGSTMRTALIGGIAALALGACAPAATGGGDGDPTVLRVEVRNNYPTAVNREVFLAEPGGTPRRIGQIPAAATRRLDARAVDWQQQHVLVAESLTGDVIQSAPFFVSPGGRVVWNLANNRVDVIEP